MSERILRMPRLGETMEEGKVVGWLVAPGDSFRRGDPILEIETDKTIAEFPALGDGRLDEILASAGDTLEVGAPIARIDIGDGPDWTVEDGGDAAAESPARPADAAGRIETDLVMPRLGETMEEGRIAKWLKAAGETFVRGEAIIEIETDKTVAEFPALTDGRLVAILRQEDETVAVGEPIARIEVAEEKGATTTAAPSEKEPAVRHGRQKPARSRHSDRIRATPLARRLARRHGLNIATLSGTGRRGRVEKNDVLAAVAGAPSAHRAAASADVLFAYLDRGRLAYLDSGPGTGNPILLLHGFSGDRTGWAALASGLRRAGRRVVVPDLPGHGLTEIVAARADDLSADLPELLDTLRLDRVDVVAHSLGAVAAMDLAAAAGGRVASLCLIAPAGLGLEIDQEFVHGMAGAQAAGEVAHLLRRLSESRSDLSDAALEALAADLSKGRLLALAESFAGPAGQRVDILAKLQRLAGSIPIRVLFGLEDRIIPWKHALALPPRVAIHLLSRSGHMPQWDQTKDVLDILLS